MENEGTMIMKFRKQIHATLSETRRVIVLKFYLNYLMHFGVNNSFFFAVHLFYITTIDVRGINHPIKRLIFIFLFVQHIYENSNFKLLNFFELYNF